MTLTNADINSTGTIDITSGVDVSSNLRAISINGPGSLQTRALLAIGYGEANASSSITIESGSALDAVGDITVDSNATAKSLVRTSVTGNAAISGGQNEVLEAFGIAVAVQSENSSVSLDKDSISYLLY